MTPGEIADLITAAAAVGSLAVSTIALFWIREVKHATNSIMDARVMAANSEGRQQQRDEDKIK